MDKNVSNIDSDKIVNRDTVNDVKSDSEVVETNAFQPVSQKETKKGKNTSSGSNTNGIINRKMDTEYKVAEGDAQMCAENLTPPVQQKGRKNAKTTTTKTQLGKRGRRHSLTDLHVPEKMKKMSTGEAVESAYISSEIMSKIENTIQASMGTMKQELKDSMKTGFQNMIAEVMQSQLDPFKTDLQNQLDEMERKMDKLENDNQVLIGLKKQIQKIESTAQSHKGEVKKLTGTIADMSQRLLELEQSNSNSEQNFTEFEERLDVMEKQVSTNKLAQLPAAVDDDADRKRLVIKRLPEAEGEDENSAVTLTIVNELLHDGLNIHDVKVVSAERKTKSKVIFVQLESEQQRTQILKKKSDLRNHSKFSRVFIEPILPYNVRKERNNTRTLLNAVGKRKHYQFNRKGFLVKTPKHVADDKSSQNQTASGSGGNPN
jgi:hypothetical protein